MAPMVPELLARSQAEVEPPSSPTMEDVDSVESNTPPGLAMKAASESAPEDTSSERANNGSKLADPAAGVKNGQIRVDNGADANQKNWRSDWHKEPDVGTTDRKRGWSNWQGGCGKGNEEEGSWKGYKASSYWGNNGGKAGWATKQGTDAVWRWGNSMTAL